MRKLARPGLSYVDANQGRLVTTERDVLDIKSQIESRWRTLECAFDVVDLKWCIIEHCNDGVDRLVFDTDRLNGDTIKRIERADGSVRGQEDVLSDIDSYNAAIERDQDRRFEDSMGDVGERLVHAFGKDGLISRPKAFFSSDHGPHRSKNSSKTIRV